jgi:hypothetical protein
MRTLSKLQRHAYHTEAANTTCVQAHPMQMRLKKILESGRAPAPTVADPPKLLWVYGVGKPRAETASTHGSEKISRSPSSVRCNPTVERQLIHTGTRPAASSSYLVPAFTMFLFVHLRRHHITGLVRYAKPEVLAVPRRLRTLQRQNLKWSRGRKYEIGPDRGSYRAVPL